MTVPSDSFTVHDIKTGETRTFFCEDMHFYLGPGGDQPFSRSESHRVERFGPPTGFLRSVAIGLRGKGEIQFVDESERKWSLSVTASELRHFMAWVSAARPYARKEDLPLPLRTRLERAERARGRFHTFLLGRVLPIGGQKNLGDRGVALVALSDKEALVVTQEADVSDAFPGSLVRVGLSEMRIETRMQSWDWPSSSQDREMQLGLLLGTRAKNQVCRLTLGSQHSVFLQMHRADIKYLRRRLASAPAAHLLSIVQAYEDAANRHDLEATIATFADDAKCEFVGMEPLLGKEAIRDFHDYNIGTNFQLQFRHCHPERDTVTCEAVLTSDWHQVTGIGEAHYPRVFFTFKHGLINSIGAALSTESAKDIAEVMQAFLLWAEKNHPLELATLSTPQGQFIHSRENGELLVKLLRAWRKAMPLAGAVAD